MRDTAEKDADSSGSPWLIPVALIAAFVSAFWAWELASASFAPVPVISNPGAIVIATYGSSNGVGAITSTLEYKASTQQQHTNYQIFLTQQGPSGAANPKPLKVVIFLCGAAEINPDFIVQGPNLKTSPIAWHNISPGSYAFGFGGFIFPQDCSYTTIPLVFSAISDSSEAILIGHTDRPPSTVSGAAVAYAWPGIFTLPQAISINNFSVSPLPKGSSYTVGFNNVPNDMSNAVTDPELTSDVGGFYTTEQFNRGFAVIYPQFRLTGDLSNSEATAQKNLFIAGALVGIAGGAVVWLLELLTKTLLAARSTSETAQRQEDNRSASGLGWPG